MKARTTPLTPGSLRNLRERSGWRLRAAGGDELKALLGGWIAADPDHVGRVDAETWLAERKGVENLLVVDREAPLMFLRCSNVMRIDIQFAPGAERRTAMALVTGVPWLAAQAKKRGYSEMIFESGSKKLVRFLGRLGFHASAREHILSL